MYFADLFFLFVFFPLCLAAYFAAKNISTRNYVLIAFSLVFYAFGEPVMVLLLMVTALVNYFFGVAIDANRGKKVATFLLGAALVYDIGMLGIYKYTDFVIDNLNGIFALSLPHAEITLPLGISFYTFQIISYVIDVYWGNVKVQRSYSKLLLYVSLFPQLVAGPIVRYETIESEIDRRVTTPADFSAGMIRAVIGLSKKVLLANNLNLLVNGCFGEDPLTSTVLGTWVGVIAYSMQVYFDFSGYSDMAIGMGRIFGFHFDENFNYPFMCRSIAEFWQRWHISLGSFFRDYLLYVPIFGRRRQILSLFLVWFTTGLWHGASWNFVIWGLYFGVFIFIETKIGKKRLKNAPGLLMHIYNKVVIIIGFGIFRFENMSHLGAFFANLVGARGNGFTNIGVNETIMSYLVVFVVSLIACLPIVPAMKKRIEAMGSGAVAVSVMTSTVVAGVLLFVSTAVLVATHSSNNPFLYWRF